MHSYLTGALEEPTRRKGRRPDTALSHGKIELHTVTRQRFQRLITLVVCSNASEPIIRTDPYFLELT